MLHQVLEANGGLQEGSAVVFANTGKEMPQTLDFVHECEMRWNVPIIWVELGEVGVDPGAILIEPSARNTAPALLAAALVVAQSDPQGLILAAPSDHKRLSDWNPRSSATAHNQRVSRKVFTNRSPFNTRTGSNHHHALS